MISAAKIGDEWKLIHVRAMSATRAKRIMRIYSIASDHRIPEEVLEERVYGSGIFHNFAQKVKFILQGEKLVQI